MSRFGDDSDGGLGGLQEASSGIFEGLDKFTSDLDDYEFDTSGPETLDEALDSPELSQNSPVSLNSAGISSDDPDVIRYWSQYTSDSDELGALRADVEFDGVAGTRPEFPDPQLRDADLETVSEERVLDSPRAILVQLEDPTTVPDGLDDYMDEHGYERLHSHISPVGDLVEEESYSDIDIGYEIEDI